MTRIRLMAATAIAAFSLSIAGQMAHGDVVTPVTGWIIHNGTGTFTGISNTTSSPQLVVADNQTLVAPVTAVGIPNVGDFISVTTTMTLGTRGTNLLANNLNTQLRIGLLNGANALNPGVSGYTGFLTIYSNQLAPASLGNLAEQQNTAATSPLQNQTAIGTPPSAGQDDDGDSIFGGNAISADFTLTLIHRATGLEIYSNISSAQFDYEQEVTFAPYSPGIAGFNFATFNFNRVAFFFGGNVDGTSGGGLNNTQLTTGNVIPESRFGLLAVAIMMGSVLAGLKLRRAWRRQG